MNTPKSIVGSLSSLQMQLQQRCSDFEDLMHQYRVALITIREINATLADPEVKLVQINRVFEMLQEHKYL